MYYRKKIRVPIYDSFDLIIIISDDVAKINKDTNSNETDYYAQTVKTYHKIKGSTFVSKAVTLVFNPNREGTDKITAGVIAHEAIHVKNMIFGAIGLVPTTTNDEAEAYFVEWIVDTITNFFNQSLEREKLLKEL